MNLSVLELIQTNYIKNAILVAFCGGAMLSLVGSLLNGMQSPFLGVVISHAAFLGAAFALWCGGFIPIYAIITALLASLLIAPIVEKGKITSNVAMSIVFALTMAVALIFISRISGNRTEALNILWGSILTVSTGEALFILILFIISTLSCTLFIRGIKAVLFNKELAKASGIPANIIYYSIIILASTIIAIMLDKIGGLLIFSLLAIPSSTAILITNRFNQMLALSAALGVVECLTGLYISALLDLPVGPAAVLVAGTLYFVVLIIKNMKAKGI